MKVKNPIILPEDITKKFIILDILATDESGHIFEIEMQVRQYDWYSKRSLYYVSKIYADQLDSGDEYDKLLPVIGIHFLDYEEFPDQDDFHFCFELRDIRHPELKFTDDLAIHIFELPKFERLGKGGFGDEGSEMMPLIRHIQDCDRLRAIKDAIRNAKDFAEMKAIIGN